MTTEALVARWALSSTSLGLVAAVERADVSGEFVFIDTVAIAADEAGVSVALGASGDSMSAFDVADVGPARSNGTSTAFLARLNGLLRPTWSRTIGTDDAFEPFTVAPKVSALVTRASTEQLLVALGAQGSHAFDSFGTFSSGQYCVVLVLNVVTGSVRSVGTLAADDGGTTCSSLALGDDGLVIGGSTQGTTRFTRNGLDTLAVTDRIEDTFGTVVVVEEARDLGTVGFGLRFREQGARFILAAQTEIRPLGRSSAFVETAVSDGAGSMLLAGSVFGSAEAGVLRVAPSVDGGFVFHADVNTNPQCRALEACGVDGVCDPRTFTCIARCEVNTDCSGGRVCDGLTGLCLAATTPCSDGEVTDANGACVPHCGRFLPGALCSATDECCDDATGLCTTASPILADSYLLGFVDGVSLNNVSFFDNGPGPRRGAALLPRGTSSFRVLFGREGSDDTSFDDGNVVFRDGSGWSSDAITIEPACRFLDGFSTVVADGTTWFIGGDVDGGGRSGTVCTFVDGGNGTPSVEVEPVSITSRRDAGAAAVGSNVYVFGGRDASGALLGDLARATVGSAVDFTTVVTTGQAPAPRAGAVLVPHPAAPNLLMLIGGLVSDGAGGERTTAEVVLFDIETNTWDPPLVVSGLPPLAFAGAATIDGAVILVGGSTSDSTGNLVSRRDIFELRQGRDTLALSNVDTGEARLPRLAAPAVAAFSSTVFVFGGDSLDTEAVCSAPIRN